MSPDNEGGGDMNDYSQLQEEWLAQCFSEEDLPDELRLNNILIVLSQYKGEKKEFFHQAYDLCLKMGELEDLVQVFRSRLIPPRLDQVKEIVRLLLVYEKSKKKLPADILEGLGTMALLVGLPKLFLKLLSRFDLSPTIDQLYLAKQVSLQQNDQDSLRKVNELLMS